MKNPKRMTPGWISSYRGEYSIMNDDGSFTLIYKDVSWDLDMSRKGFIDRVNNVKNELYSQIKEKGIIPLKKANLEA